MNKNKLLLSLLGLGSLALALKFKQNQSKSSVRDQETKYVLVTGASTGIGLSITETLVNEGYFVFATVRKSTDAQRLTAMSKNIRPLIMDVTNHDQVIEARKIVDKELGHQTLFAIINNAGIAVPGPLEKLPVDELRWQFEVNIFGLLDVTQVFFDLLDINYSKIINISSLAGRMANPFLGPYSATKHALEALTDSLRRELVDTGIDVISVQPGMIATPIWDKADQIDIGEYHNTRYYKALKRFQNFAVTNGKKGIPPEEVSKVIVDALNKKQPPTRYIVAGNPLRDAYLPRLLPDRIIDTVIKRTLFKR